MEKKNFIGLTYVPHDNSFCRDISNDKPALLTSKEVADQDNLERKKKAEELGILIHKGDYEDEYLGPDKEEEGSEFTIVHGPYKEKVLVIGTEKKEEEFVNVKSSKTNKVYRVLFNEKWISDFQEIKEEPKEEVKEEEAPKEEKMEEKKPSKKSTKKGKKKWF